MFVYVVGKGKPQNKYLEILIFPKMEYLCNILLFVWQKSWSNWTLVEPGHYGLILSLSCTPVTYF